MDVDIKIVDGVLQFNAIQVVTESQHRKMQASINQQRIAGWCADNGNVSVKTEGGVQYTVVMKQIVDNVTKTSIHETAILLDKFLEFVDTLPEVNVENEEPSEEDTVKFVQELLDDINEDNIVGANAVAFAAGPFCVAPYTISQDLLKEFCESYLKAHEHKSKNN